MSANFPKHYRRERYLSRIRPFMHDSDLIKVITGIRRCGKSCLMEDIASELVEGGIPAKDIVFIDLEKRGYRKVRTPDELERAIVNALADDDFKYLFIDEVQNVSGFEEVVNAYRAEGRFSIFITGSNSYLLSGELMTKLTGRYVEFEMLPLAFDEYLGMRKFLNKPEQSTIESFREWLKYGGFPKAVEYDDPAVKSKYIEEVVAQIIKKDIYARSRVRNRDVFERVMDYVINNYASPTNIEGIARYLNNEAHIPIKRQTLARYIDLLVAAKVLYKCKRFDLKSKKSLRGGEKYYLADTGIYFSRNVDASMNYGPLLENAAYTWMRSKDYRVSVGRIGTLEVDFIARWHSHGYAYIQVSASIVDPAVEKREYRSFEAVRDNWPRYLLTLDPLCSSRDGVKHFNLMELMASGGGLF